MIISYLRKVGVFASLLVFVGISSHAQFNATENQKFALQQQIPDFGFTVLKADRVSRGSLADFKGKKLVLFDFWNT
ncbi:MAG: hypothetical protein J7497_17770, partial [Chitinophagaceae bacterium]|nr:hypothetical protein [Chitinophagaceae bacterium]